MKFVYGDSKGVPTDPIGVIRDIQQEVGGEVGGVIGINEEALDRRLGRVKLIVLSGDVGRCRHRLISKQGRQDGKNE
jgi:hypothetical protein